MDLAPRELHPASWITGVILEFTARVNSPSSRTMGVDPTPGALPPRELTLQAGSRNCCAWKFDGQASQLGTTSDLMPPIFSATKKTRIHLPFIMSHVLSSKYRGKYWSVSRHCCSCILFDHLDLSSHSGIGSINFQMGVAEIGYPMVSKLRLHDLFSLLDMWRIHHFDINPHETNYTW